MTGSIRLLVFVVAALIAGAVAWFTVSKRRMEAPVAATPVAATPVAAAAGTPDALPVVTLERGPCYGQCPEYRVQLFENGSVIFEGRRNVKTVGTVERAVPAQDIRTLLQEFEQGPFNSVDTLFLDGKPACGQYRADMPVSVLTARLASHTRTVQHDPGCRNAPQFLRTLEARVDSVARTHILINGTGGQDQ